MRSRPATRGLPSRWLAGAAAASLIIAQVACDAPRSVPRSLLDEPQQLTFRCVREEGSRQEGVPLEGCGCTDRRTDEAGESVVRRMGRVECSCTTIRALDDDPTEPPSDPDQPPSQVEWVRVEPESCQPTYDGAEPDGWICEPARHVESGDWVPCVELGGGAFQCGAERLPAAADGARPVAMPCEPARGGEVRAYVAATGRGEVAILDLSDDNRIDDVDRTIPGNTAILIDDIITDIGSHPDGDFVFTVNSSRGSVSVILDDRQLKAAFEIELATGPLHAAVVSPPPEAPRTAATLAMPRRAYLTVPASGDILEVDLDRLRLAGPASAGGLGPDAEWPVTRVISLRAEAGAAPPTPGALAVDPAGRALYVAHLNAPRISVIDLADPLRQAVIELDTRPCADGYLVDVLDSARQHQTCDDGIDNDLDGLIDSADPDCVGGAWEGTVLPRCPQLPECNDGVDNDGDGFVDLLDSDCIFVGQRWEIPTPACADGADNDGDGRTDRADPDCASEADQSEAGREISTCVDGVDNDGDGQVDGDDESCRSLEDALPEAAALPEEISEAPCTDGIDNDADGLVDVEDPGCRDAFAAERYRFEREPECGDDKDNDHDGLVDFPVDPDCWGAADDNEGGDGLRLGPADLLAVRLPLGAAAPGAVGPARSERMFLYALDRASGRLVHTELAPSDGFPTPISAPRAARLPRPVLEIALRQRGGDASVLLIDDEATLRSLEITAPVPVRDQAGRPVFARIEVIAQGGCNDGVDEAGSGDGVDLADEGCLSAEDGSEAAGLQPAAPDARRITGVTAFYVVEDGQAWRVRGLERWHGIAWESERLELELPDDVEITSLVPAAPAEAGEPDAGIDGAVDGGGPDAEPDAGVDDGADPHRADPRRVEVIPDRGAADPMVFVSRRRRVLHHEANVVERAQARTNRIAAPPSVTVEGTSFRDTLRRLPGFCRSGTARGLSPAPPDLAAGEICEGAVPYGLEAACIPSGIDVRGDTEPADVVQARIPYQMGSVEGIEVIEEDPQRLVSDRFTLAYEAQLPATESRTGRYGRWIDEHTWSLLDYEQDLCRRGVEVGDVVLVDRLVPLSEAAADQPGCARLIAQAPITPLRYRVLEVRAHVMVLGCEGRDAYVGQASRDARSPTPKIEGVAPAAPRWACAAQLIRYRVRVGDDQWLLVGDRLGYRHPWTSLDGECVRHPRLVRERRLGRARLGQPFENEWFRFRLGFLAEPEQGAVVPGLGVPPGSLPYMVGVAFQFDLLQGLVNSTLPQAALLPREMRWLPFDDRLYIVDSAFRTVVEVTGLDVYQNDMRVVRSFN